MIMGSYLHRHSRNTCVLAPLALLYGITIVALSALWACVPSAQAYAYVDPSVMTYTIQAVAGLAVALSAVIGVVFRRTRKKIYELFKIDENANKFNESDVSRINPDDSDAGTLFEEARANAEAMIEGCEEHLGKKSALTLTWPKRFAFALVMTVFMAFIVFVAPALELFGANTDSLVFSLQSVWWIPVLFCSIAAVVLALAISLLQGRPFYAVLMALFVVTIAAYVQSLFLNQGMMPADGGFIGWTEPYFRGKMIVSGIIWVVILAVPIPLSLKRHHTWLKATTAVACVVMVMQLVGVASVAVDSSKTALDSTNQPYVTQGSLLTVSERNNVIVFVLDTFDTSILEELLAEDPDFLDDFEDFVYYPDSVGTMIPTTNAIPNLLTGMKPKPGEDIAEYRRTKYEKGTFISDIYDMGYSIGIYSDSLMMDFSLHSDRAVADMTQNVHPVSQAPIDVFRTFVAMEQCALYREAPWVLKPAFWYYTSDLNNRMIADSGTANLDDSLYELNDAAILKLMRESGLQVADEDFEGSFRFIHLFGPHFPYNVDENGQEVGTNESNRESQAKGSMRVVMEYLKQLKELGLYDEATIIVTADHGVWFLTDPSPREPISPIMLVKTAKADDGGRQPLVKSDMPVSHEEIRPTVIEAMGGDYEKYGITFDKIDDPDRVRYFDALSNASGDGQYFIEYAITGPVSDLANWHATGNEWKDA